jgi:two-component system, sensor histidine kinase PdtaS
VRGEDDAPVIACILADATDYAAAVPSLNDVARAHTDLSDADLDWLHALVSEWQLLADLSFADLVLWLPARGGLGFYAGAQMRPTTGPTAYVDDLVGTFAPRGRRLLLDAAFDEGRICREGDPEWRDDVPVRVETIPVRRGRRVIAVVARNTNLVGVRTPSRLELTYLGCAADLATMIAEGRFPLPGGQPDLGASPRVGDGLIRLDGSGLVTYASPNALSAFRRLGLTADLLGAHLGRAAAALAPERGAVDEALPAAVSGRSPRQLEVENRHAVLQLRVIPLRPHGERIGALVLVRDVTELRRRERELVTKDTTIREIHHRVKNNLQTVAALLRLQARRIDAPEGRAALEEAVARVGSIAVVHETLSHAPDEQADFDEVVDRVIAMVTDVASGEVRVVPRRHGTFGPLAAEIATPLAMVLTELLQNALEHGLHRRPGAPAESGSDDTLLEVTAYRSAAGLRVEVADNGVGLPANFDATQSANLGLHIVRTLVVGELGGRLKFAPRPGGGTVVRVDVPLGR